MTYMLETVLGLDPDSEVHKAMTLNQILSPCDLCGLDKSDIEQLEYPTATAGVTDKLPKGMIGSLNFLKNMLHTRQQLANPSKILTG